MTKQFLLFLIGLSFSCASYSSSPPVGFEQAAEEQEQMSDVIFMGMPVGLHKVKLGSKKLTFVEPDALLFSIQKVLDLENSSAKLLKKHLADDFVRNDEKSCSAKPVLVGCDYLSTESVGLIYNDLDAHILLFGRADLFDKKSSARYFTPTSGDTENGFIHQQAVNFLYGDNYQTAYISGIGTLGLDDKSYVVADWDGVRIEGKNQGHSYSESQINLDTLFYRRDFDRERYGQIGRMGASDLSSKLGGGFSFTFFPAMNIEGARLGKAFAYENHEGDQSAQPLVVILVSPARVDVYKTGKLLGTHYLRAGPNTINTNQFPSGDYPVTLNIYEGDRLVRTEESRVSISRGRNTANESAWFLQMGKIDSRAAAEGSGEQWVAQYGYGVTLLDNYYMSAAVGLQQNSSYAEFTAELNKGVDLLSSDVSLKTTFFIDAVHSRGDAQHLSINNQWISATFSHDNLVSSACERTRQWAPEYFGCFETINAYLGFTVADVSFNAGYTRALSGVAPFYDPYSANPAIPVTRASESYQAMLNRSFSMGDYNLMLGAGLFRNFGVSSVSDGVDKGAFLSVTLSANKSGNLDYSVSNRLERGSVSGSRTTTDVFLSKQWDDQTKELSVNATDYKTSLSDEHRRGGSISAENRSGHGKYYAALSQTQQSSTFSDQTLRMLSGSYASTLAIISQGLALGPYGQGQVSGAVLAQSSGNDADSEFSLTAGGNKANVSSGKTALLPVPQYQHTFVEVTSLSKNNNAFDHTTDQGHNELFLLPGKINQRHIYTQRTILLFINRFMFNGNAVIPVQFKGVESSSFYAEGRAAIEVKTDQATLQLMTDGARGLTCHIPPQPDSHAVNFIEEVKCESRGP